MSKNTDIVSMYKEMLFLRRSEEAIGKLYTMQKINGFCHLYIGQEAIAVGVKHAMRPQDSIITSYRCHGFLLALGTSLDSIVAELMGKDSGISRGRGGSMHMFDPERGFYGGHGIVGAQVSLGTGMAFSYKYKEVDSLCYCVFGDGALNQGQVYESFNLASLWNLPVIYLLENNIYAMGTKIDHSTANSRELFRRGESFGIRGIRCNGMDVLDVFEKVQEGIEYYKNQQKPILIELQTYRYRGHSMSDPALYRDKEEVDNYKKEDPISRILQQINKQNLLNEQDIEDIEDEISQKIEHAIKFAEDSEFPDVSDLYNFIYKD